MRRRHLTSMIGGVLLAPLFVVIPVDLSVAGPAPSPVEGAASEATLVDASRPEASAAAGLSAKDTTTARTELAKESGGTKELPAALTVLKATPPQAVPEKLAGVAVTWAKGTGDKIAVQIRTKRANGWTDWENLQVDASSGPDEGRTTAAREGSELYMVSGATAVEGRVLGAAGHAPVDPKLTVIDPGASDADAVVGAAQPGAAHAVSPRPNIYTRAQWGADESWRTGRPENNVPKGIVIHHTADTNNYTADMVPGMLRSMYRYATKTLGWDDIAYNFIIDRWGRIWQGRAWLYPEQPVFPAAQLSNNDRGVGVSMLGNYESEVLSSSARSSLVKLLAWKASLHGINPLGTTSWYNNKTDRYESMPTINGHRDHYYTACPGANLYPLIPAIRREVAAAMGSGSSTPNTSAVPNFRDFDGMLDSDVLARDADGRLSLSSPDGRGNMTPVETIGGSGWGVFDVVTIVGDWNGDGTADIIARNRNTAELWLYPGDGHGSFLDATRIGVGWNDMQTIVAAGDWDGDGKPDIIGTNRTNWNMYFYGGDGRGGFRKSGIPIGWGWGQIKSFAGVGDWNGDGKPDLAGMTFDGLGVIYYGSGATSFKGQTNQSGSWASYRTLTGIRNPYGDDKAGILAVDGAGNAYIGARASDTSVTWKRAAQSFAGYTVYAG